MTLAEVQAAWVNILHVDMTAEAECEIVDKDKHISAYLSENSQFLENI